MRLAALMAIASLGWIWIACSSEASIVRFIEVHPDTIFITDTLFHTDTLILTDTLIHIDTVLVTDTICGCK